jgi:hypothetical protein
MRDEKVVQLLFFISRKETKEQRRREQIIFFCALFFFASLREFLQFTCIILFGSYNYFSLTVSVFSFACGNEIFAVSDNP